MASVYLAQDTRSHNTPVAIKQNLHSASLEDQRLFEKEARLLTSLRTRPSRPRNLPLVLEYFTEVSKGQHIQCLVMDYIEGEDLDSVLQRSGVLEEKIVLFWISQIMTALEFLHNQSSPIVHRDIKPGNIRLADRGQIAYLVDFGIAGVTQQKFATPGFSPLEQYRGLIYTDARSDIYALGATLYALVTGQGVPPAPDLDQGKKSLRPPKQVAPVSDVVNDVILRALQLDPDQRYQTVAEMRQALKPVLPGTKPKTLRRFRLQVQQPVPLDPPPQIRPHQTCAWWAEPGAVSMRLALNRRGDLLVSGGSSGVVRFWSVPDWRSLGRLLGQGKHTDWIRGLAVSQDGRWVASASADRTIMIWDARTAQLARPSLRGHDDAVFAVALSPDGRWLASASYDRTIRLWHTFGTQSDILAQDVVAEELSFSPDGRWLVAACHDGNLRVWDVQNWQAVTLPPEISDHGGMIATVAFSPDGMFLASGGADQFIHLCETRDPKTGTILAPSDWKRRYIVGRYPGSIYKLAFGPDSRLLAIGGSDKTVQVWDVPHGQFVGAMGPFPAEILGVAFGPSWYWLAVVTKNGIVSLWQLT